MHATILKIAHMLLNEKIMLFNCIIFHDNKLQNNVKNIYIALINKLIIVVIFHIQRKNFLINKLLSFIY